MEEALVASETISSSKCTSTHTPQRANGDRDETYLLLHWRRHFLLLRWEFALRELHTPSASSMQSIHLRRDSPPRHFAEDGESYFSHSHGLHTCAAAKAKRPRRSKVFMAAIGEKQESSCNQFQKKGKCGCSSITTLLREFSKRRKVRVK
jgi:hypothetical protein